MAEMNTDDEIKYREIGSTAEFLQIGDTFKTTGSEMLLRVRDLGLIYNRIGEKVYQCYDTAGDGWTLAFKNSEPIILCI